MKTPVLLRNTYLLVLAMAMLATSCRKNFLDEPKPTQSVTSEDVFKTEEGVRAYLHGIYSKMRQPWFPIGATAFNSTDNWGYIAINLTRVNKGIDIINPGGWYQFDYRLENREPTYRRTIFTWQFFYESINQANILIEGVEQSSTLAASVKAQLLAEGRALRAWMYFELAREFQHTIAKDANAPGIPLYTQPTSIDNKGKPRGTLRQVFDLINEDLAFAVQNLGTQRSYKSQITKPVAYGMQARVALEQGQWAAAAEAALKARDGFALDRNRYRGNFSDIANSPEVIWGFPQTITGSSQSLYYGTPSSFFEKTGQGYDNFYMYDQLVNSFTNSDIRNTFFITNAASGNQRRFSTNKFGSTTSSTVTLITGQTVALRQTDFEEGLPMMRVAEMLLIEAEARAEQGQTAAAKALLFQLQKNRDPDAAESANTGAALIAEILLERRKELYGELGIDYLDIKRRQLPLQRAGNHPVAYRFNLAPNAQDLVLKIPQRELDTNEFIGPADQNQ
ncbi:MAG TPA: RagB/SusD family nutrient uptake outer membrane protein [Phnomibacter sp.]|nr:RagB/SusD family nutrient uptake outer membrane protein [Phnomibacter sp.]